LFSNKTLVKVLIRLKFF